MRVLIVVSESLGESLTSYELHDSKIQIHFKKNLVNANECGGCDLFALNLDRRSLIASPITLTQDEADEFMHAVINQYWFEMFLDDLPIWGAPCSTSNLLMQNHLFLRGLVGDQGGPPRLYTHKAFTIKYNKDRVRSLGTMWTRHSLVQVIEVSLNMEKLVPIEAHKPLLFTYSVTWEPTADEFEARFDRYLDNKFFEHQVVLPAIYLPFR